MKLLSALWLSGVLAVSACATTGPQLGADGRPLTQAVRINAADTGEIQFRTLDSVNTLRGAKNLAPLQLNAQLNAAAATHSRDMSVQNRPWHFGSDGSSPLDRVRRVGYSGKLVGELISETFQTELETLSDWMAEADTRAIILDPAASEMGFSWFQEPNGKIWWTMITGSSQPYAPPLAGLPQG